MDVPCSFDAKYRWLQRHFPFIPPSQIVFCGDKTIVDADYLIDDRPRHFAKFKGQAVLFSAPHNAGETRYTRVASWKEVRDHFTRLDFHSEGRRPSDSPARSLAKTPEPHSARVDSLARSFATDPRPSSVRRREAS